MLKSKNTKQETKRMKRKTGFRIGDSLSTVHRLLFILLTLSLLAAFAPRAEAVEATNTGGYMTTYTDAGGTNWIYHVFTNAGATGMKFHTLAAGGTVEVFMVAGGGSGGGSQYNGGAGGAGGLIYTNYAVTHNTDYAVSVGPGGTALAGNSTAQGNTGQNSTFGSSLTAYGGGGGGNYSSGAGKSGGSGGGGAGNNCGSYTNGGIATVVSPMQGNKGGNGYPSSGAMGSGGGGGAGFAGGDGTSTAGGNGGDGLYVAAFTNWGDTNTNYRGYFAGGGGGGVMSGSSAGTGGKGGGGQGGTNASGVAGSGVAGQPNTGGGGGGPRSHNTSAYGGAGGSGIVILRYQSLPPALPASGGDITYPTNLNGKVYGVHIFTNTVGTNYFTSTRDFKVEYLVIGGGGAGGNGFGGGGGAGGYRCSVLGELSGSNSTAEAVYPVSAGIPYPVVVGAGGVLGAANATGNKGGDSWFTNIVSTGGGGGRERNPGTGNPNGGSGGGGGYIDGSSGSVAGTGTAGQGFKGGNCGAGGGYRAGGGGGGAGSAGTIGASGTQASPYGSGGTGLWSSITGVAVGRAGGGGGRDVTWGDATNYGGGVCVVGPPDRTSGAPSTGGGGAGLNVGTCKGGSGVVILRYDMTPPTITVDFTSHGFVDVVVNATGTWSYTVSGIALTNNLTVSAPSAEFTVSSNGVDFGSQVVLSTNTDGTVSTTTITVHFIPTNVASFAGTITNASPGAADVTVQVTGNGIDPQPVLYVTPDSLSLGNVITNKPWTNFVYTLSGILLQGDVTVTAPSDYFKVSSNGTDFVSSFALSTNASGGLGSTPIYVQFTPSNGPGQYLGSITNSSLNATNKTVALTGTGVVQTLYVSAGTLAFGYVITNTTAGPTNYTVWGSNLEANVTVTAPSAAVTVSTNNLTGFGASCTVLVANANAPSGASLTSTPVYVKFTPTALGAYSGAITNSSAGAADQPKAVSGTGVNPPATVSITAPTDKQMFNNGDSVSLTATVVPGTAPYGVKIYTNRFSGGYGVATNATGAGPAFTVSLGVLTAGTYHAYATVTDSVSSVVYISATNTFVVQPPVPAGMLASGGDVTTIYTDPLSGRKYACHQYTNVGEAAFVPIHNLNVEYLVIAGGGGGGGGRAGGGGAGGYRCSVQSELSGSNSTAEAIYPISAGVAYPVVVGAGGAGGGLNTTGNKGGDSWFTNIVSIGGGGGKERSSTANANGGSGGGGGYLNDTEPQPGGSGTAGQGFKGGSAVGNADGNKASYGGGGGGAGSPGTDGKLISDPWGSGGTGLVSQITGVAVGRAGGGGGNYGGTTPGTPWGVATNYGGGIDITGRRDGATSTGGGGGPSWFGTGGAGGSGVVILRYDITPPKGTLFMMR